MLEGLEARLSGIGDMRFINGILGNFTRTIAFRMTENRSRMEPASEVSQGVIGFHFRSARASQIKMAQLAGEESDWDSALLDTVASRLMILDMQSQKKPCHYRSYSVGSNSIFSKSSLPTTGRG